MSTDNRQLKQSAIGMIILIFVTFLGFLWLINLAGS